MPEREFALRNENRWYKLDNAAKIYPAVTNSTRASVYRMSAELRETIEPEPLQKALDMTLSRFPTFNVRMQKGLFWYYFEQNPAKASVFQEQAPVCRPIDRRETSGFLFRVSYHNTRISLEVYHVLSDGTGAVAFLKALVFNYLTLLGKPVVADETILDGTMCPAVGEVEDSFLKYYDETAISSRAESRAYQIKGTRIAPQFVRLTQGIIPPAGIKALAAACASTVTEYIAALIIYAVWDTQLKGRGSRLPVKISVPVNLRNILESNTLRNFSSYINVGMVFDRGAYAFEDVLGTVRDQMRTNVKKEKLIGKIGANVSAERSPFMRLTPLFLKNIALKTAYRMYGERLVTTTLSNIGVISLPDSMREYVRRFDFILGAPVLNALSCAVCSFEDSMTVSFTRVMEETDIERFFFRFLARQGLDIVIESNYGALL